jgi:hypothetical protein
LNKNNIAIYEELEGTQLKQGEKKSESWKKKRSW